MFIVHLNITCDMKQTTELIFNGAPFSGGSNGQQMMACYDTSAIYRFSLSKYFSFSSGSGMIVLSPGFHPAGHTSP